MELLNDTQLERVWQTILISNIQDEDLKHELLDHICCFIEEKIYQGFSFEAAYQAALEAVAPKGIKEIEDELTLVLTYNPQTFMKRILYVATFLTTFLHTLHFLCQHLKLPNSQYLYQAGFYILCLVVLPSLSVISYRNRKFLSGLDKFRMSIGIISAGIISIGMIGKGLYLPGSGMTVSIGMVLFIFIFLPIFFFQLYQSARF